MATIGRINTVVSATTKPLTGALGKAVKSLKGFGRVSLNVAKQGLFALTAGITAAGAAAVTASVKFSQTAKALSKLSAQTGASTNELSKMQAIGDRLGIDPDDLTGSIEELNIRLGETIRDGTGPASEAFKQLGLDAKRLADLPLSDRFGEIADALKDVQNQATRGFLADEIFGGDAFKILPALRQGSAGMAEIIQQGERLGTVLSEEDVAAGKKLGESFNSLKASFRGISNTVAIEVLPVIQTLADRVTAFAATGQQRIKGFIDTVKPPLTAFLRFTGTGFETLAKIMSKFWGGAANTGAEAFKHLGKIATEFFTLLETLTANWEKTWKLATTSAALQLARGTAALSGDPKWKGAVKILEDDLRNAADSAVEGFGENLARNMKKFNAEIDVGKVPDFSSPRMPISEIADDLSLEDRQPVGAVERGTTQAYASIFKAIRQDESVQKMLKMNHDEAVKQTKRLSQAYRELQKLNRNPELGIVVGEI